MWVQIDDDLVIDLDMIRGFLLQSEEEHWHIKFYFKNDAENYFITSSIDSKAKALHIIKQLMKKVNGVTIDEIGRKESI